ncbi:hypothetical protein EBZ37_07750 [bacterium]|nr:hypothetical protein [bacterium]
MITRIAPLLILFSPLLLGAGGFKDTCSELVQDIQFSYAFERELKRVAPDLLTPAQKKEYAEAKAFKLKAITNGRKEMIARAKQLNCAIPTPPSSEEMDQLIREQKENFAKAQQDKNPPTKSDGSNEVIADFTKRFPELECRNWSITKRPNDSLRAGANRLHYTVIARTRKKTKLDGLDYPANSELFLEGLSEDLLVFDSKHKVFRRVRIIARTP